MSPATLPALIIPIREATARAWARGELSDHQLAARVDVEHPEAVYAAALYSRAGWRAGVCQVRFWISRGARLFITRTKHPVLFRHYARAGCLRTFQGPEEDALQWRLLAEADAFLAYFARLRPSSFILHPSSFTPSPAPPSAGCARPAGGNTSGPGALRHPDAPASAPP